jgi:hypothetical protein
VPAWQEFYAGTDPTNAASALRIIAAARSGNDLTFSWLGGVSGWQGNWSISASSNLVDWTVLESRSIPRSPSGTNTWTIPGGVNVGAKQFYRPCIELTP